MSGSTQASDQVEDTDGPAAWERALLDTQLETLGRLAEMGMAIAGAIQQRATAADATDAVLQHAAMDFARTSRAVRMTLALQSRLVRDFKTPPKAWAPSGKDGTPARRIEVSWIGEAERIEKQRVSTAVRRRAEDAFLDAETTERLFREAEERLERDDIDDLMTRPFDEIVAFIWGELGLHHLSLRVPPFAAANGGEDPLADPGEQPGEERVGVGEDGVHPPFDRVPERPHTWSG